MPVSRGYNARMSRIYEARLSMPGIYNARLLVPRAYNARSSTPGVYTKPKWNATRRLR